MKIASEQEMLELGEKIGSALISGAIASARGFRSAAARDGTPSARGDGPDGRDPERSDVPLTNAYIIELVGDVGAGKTTFTRGLAKGLGIESEITSPSFTISKSYAAKNGKVLTHYDFYRLSDPGLMSEDLQEKLSDHNQIIVIEWGESVADFLPSDHITVTINYNDDNTREVTIK